MSKSPKVFVIYYSMYGHVEKLARQALHGLEKAGASGKLYQFPETLSPELLKRLHAPPRPADVPVIKPEELSQADGFLFGMPTRFGGTPGQVRALLDGTGAQWMRGDFHGKFAGIFFSTASQGGGQETTALSLLPYLAHHGINYVPFGHKNKKYDDPNVIQGGSAWGAGTIAGNDGSRQPSPTELQNAEIQGFEFGKLLKRLH